MSNYVAGIDFGTSNSSAAITDGNVPFMVDVEGGRNTIPTALYFPDKSSEIFLYFVLWVSWQSQISTPKAAEAFNAVIKFIKVYINFLIKNYWIYYRIWSRLSLSMGVHA